MESAGGAFLESAEGFGSALRESLFAAVFPVSSSQHESAELLSAFFSLLAPSDALAGRIAAREIKTVRTESFISSGVPKVRLTKLVT